MLSTSFVSHLCELNAIALLRWLGLSCEVMIRSRAYQYTLSFVIGVFLSAPTIVAQAPPAIQMFMPGGGLPERSIRFTLVRDDGRIETLFTDTKGKFQVTGDLIREADYTIRVEGD